MDEVKAYAAARIVIGATALVATGPALRRWLGRAADRPETRLVARSAGIRDVAIGVGTLLVLLWVPVLEHLGRFHATRPSRAFSA